MKPTRFYRCKKCGSKTLHCQDNTGAVNMASALMLFSCLLLWPVSILILAVSTFTSPWYCDHCKTRR